MTGIDEIVNSKETTEGIIRKPGGGRKKIIDTEEKIDEVFFEILNHHTAGSPINTEIKWTNLSLKEILEAFNSQDMNITPCGKAAFEETWFCREKNAKNLSIKLLHQKDSECFRLSRTKFMSKQEKYLKTSRKT